MSSRQQAASTLPFWTGAIEANLRESAIGRLLFGMFGIVVTELTTFTVYQLWPPG
jgi:hypothetical protein